ncbi:MAG: FecCD family ABC transporter permease [Cellulosilyticaceae bacterium]
MTKELPYKVKLGSLILLLIGLAIVTLMMGRYPMTTAQLWDVISGKDQTSQVYTLLTQIRIPRVLLVTICGGALALSGTVYQSVFRNPLVSPDVLGVSSGCGVGAALAILFMSQISFSIQIMAFVAGILAVFIALYMAKIVQGNKLLGLVIAGIVTSSIASAITMFLKYVADPYKQLPTIEFWMMGGFYNANWQQLLSILPALIIATTVLFLLKWQLKILTLGEEEAMTLGVSVKKIRVISIICSTCLVAAVVSVAGLVSWIGLVAPHIVKLAIGDRLEREMPMTIVIGGILLLVADTISRCLFTAELPISILTTFVGAPFLAYLLYKRGKVSS